MGEPGLTAHVHGESAILILTRICDDEPVRRHGLIIVFLCAILAVVRISGVHVHFSPSNAHEAVVEVISDHDAGHIDSHTSHGDIDVEASAKSIAKLSGMSLLTALIALVWLLFVAPVVLTLRRCAPSTRPPKWRKRSYLIPPSQAPPALA